jgi:hypothetical protein
MKTEKGKESSLLKEDDLQSLTFTTKVQWITVAPILHPRTILNTASKTKPTAVLRIFELYGKDQAKLGSV